MMNDNIVLLADSEMNAKLNAQGYIVLQSFLTERIIGNILNYYKSIHLNSDKTKPNYLYLTPEKSWEINQVIKSNLEEPFNRNFKKGKFLGGVFMIKKSGENKEVDFHQDWSLVDETEYVSYNLWCPLVDTTVETGALMIIDKSDKAGLPYRSSSLPPLEVKHHKKYDRFIKKFRLKAGDAILYKHSMFHGSDNNTSSQERVAIACGIIPEKIPFVYQHWDTNKSSIISYEVDEDFYIKYIHEILAGKIPDKYKIIKETPLAIKPKIKEDDFYVSLRKLHGVKRFLFFDY
jgi:hypothetical protein